LSAYVIDASALVEYLFRTSRGIAIAAAVENGEIHAPALIDVEFSSAVVRLLRRRAIDVERAADAIADLSEIPLTRHGHLALLPRVLSLRDNFSVYDATYVALCEAIDAALITADAKLARAVAAHTRIRVTSSATRA